MAQKRKTGPSDDSSNASSDLSESPQQKRSKRAIGHDEEPKTSKTFRDLGIVEELCDATAQLGFKFPTPIQEQSIPVALQGRDLIGLAETGSGKTAAFALPMLQALLENPQPFFGLVLAPTRELAYQTAQQIEALGSLIQVRVAVIVGGMNMNDQQIAIGKNPHIIVAAPGRLLDHLENTKGFRLKHKLRYLVMDEADKLLDQDFGPTIDKILAELPTERHTYLFSATMSSKVQSLTRASLRNPVKVSVSTDALDGEVGTGPKHRTVQTLVQHFKFIPHKYKDQWFVALLSGPFTGYRSIIFARTVNEVNRLTYLLRALNIGAIPIHGQLQQDQRLAALNKFKQKARDILVATDVAARGLDIPSVDLVINYDLPGASTDYIHRVGRTARAGKSGQALSLVTQYDVEEWLRIEKALGRKVDEYTGVTQDEALVLTESVDEARKIAIRKLKDQQSSGKNGKKRTPGFADKGARKGRRENMDVERG